MELRGRNVGPQVAVRAFNIILHTHTDRQTLTDIVVVALTHSKLGVIFSSFFIQ